MDIFVTEYTGFRTNIVQFNIDQLVGASANELSAVIYWHSINAPVILTFFELGQCSFNLFLILSFITSGLTLSVVLITYSFFKHWLETNPLIINPIKLIAKVLNYARRTSIQGIVVPFLTRLRQRKIQWTFYSRGSRKCQNNVSHYSSDDLYCWTQLC